MQIVFIKKINCQTTANKNVLFTLFEMSFFYYFHISPFSLKYYAKLCKIEIIGLLLILMCRPCIPICMSIFATIFIGLGIMFVIISSLNVSPCTFQGYPPLPQWILGTGISFIIIGFSYIGAVVLSTFVFPDSISNADEQNDAEAHWSLYLHTWTILIFLLAWTIVGCISLWKDVAPCKNSYSIIWNTGMAGVILLIVLLGFVLTGV